MSAVLPPSSAAAPRAAATLLLLRERAGVETLLLRRAPRADDLHGDAWVFPGGGLSPDDRDAHAHCDGLADETASRRLGLGAGGLDYYVAALRECFEEAGLLLASDADGRMLDAARLAGLEAARAALNAGELDFATLCRTQALRLQPAALRYFAHWLTPPGLRKRFDARFFVALAPAGQAAVPDASETLECAWLTAEAALERRQELRLAHPTVKTLQWLRGFGTAAEVLQAVDGMRTVRRIMPRMGHGSKGRRPVNPDEPAYAEIGRLDPDGRGDVRYELDPGRVVTLTPRVRRITAGNGDLMTGAGTNSYLIDCGQGRDWALIDPGPDDPAHVAALIAALPGSLKWIFVTHTHKDHSPAARAIQAATGATLVGMRARHAEWQDPAFVPERVPTDGERFELGAGVLLTAVHTPGHASNHFCYLLHEDRMLFTGDHIIQGSTVVISPPDGDMREYLASLEKVRRLDVDWLAPGHGFLMDEPQAMAQQLIAHRLSREAMIAAAWQAGARTLDALRERVYVGLNPALHAMARRSILAHLAKLDLTPEA